MLWLTSVIRGDREEAHLQCRGLKNLQGLLNCPPENYLRELTAQSHRIRAEIDCSYSSFLLKQSSAT